MTGGHFTTESLKDANSMRAQARTLKWYVRFDHTGTVQRKTKFVCHHKKYIKCFVGIKLKVHTINRWTLSKKAQVAECRLARLRKDRLARREQAAKVG